MMIFLSVEQKQFLYMFLELELIYFGISSDALNDHVSFMFQGFRKVYNISGGIHAYAVQVDPSVPTY
jgi:hypothetical protein